MRWSVAVPTSPLPICVTMSNMVGLVPHQRIYAEIEGNPKIGERWGPTPLQWGCI